MMQLMRTQLRNISSSTNNAHAGLLMQRGLTVWENEDEKKKLREEKKPTAKTKLIEKITSVAPDELYLLAFNRWISATYKKENFENLAAQIEGRLFTGLSLGGTLETGVMVHHTYGMPMIAGSGIKGAVRNYAEHLFAKRDENGNIQYDNGQIRIEENRIPILDILFGTDSDDENANAGYLIWHDAWWIPTVNLETGEDCKPFVGEVVTVHHKEYYSGQLEEALDMESPVPNQQLAVQGSFYFSVEGDKKWAEFAKILLKDMLQEQGLGAKSSSGYGYFVLDDALTADIANKPIDNSDPLALIRRKIKILNSEQLIENLSKGIKKFFESLGLNKDNEEDCRKVVQVVIEEHATTIEEWSNQKGKNVEKAYKFVQKYK